jgi:hypothetical protein
MDSHSDALIGQARLGSEGRFIGVGGNGGLYCPSFSTNATPKLLHRAKRNGRQLPADRKSHFALLGIRGFVLLKPEIVTTTCNNAVVVVRQRSAAF